jgi:hypothetical protein
MNLIVRSGPDEGATVAVDRRITIGREGDFRLTDPTVSRMHAAATPTAGGVLLEDLGSTGGTVVNGTRLFGPVTLQGGEQILMGTSILELEAETAAPAPEPAAAEPAPALPVAAPPVEPAPAVSSVPPPPTPSPILPPTAPPAGGDRRRKQLIVLAVLVAIAVAVLGFVLLSGGDDDPVANGGGGGGDGATATGGGEALAPLSNLAAAPGEFSADPSTWLVTLTWDAAPAELGLDHYEVTRNGKRVSASVAEETFVDGGVIPGEELNYEVVGVGSAGTTQVAAAFVAPPELAVGDSTIDGAWRVQMRITKSNLDDVGASAAMTWDFAPSCAFGPCDATFTIRRTDLFGAIALIGGTEGEYTGVGSGEFLLDDCRGDPISEDVTVDLAVKRAEVKAGVWAAQTFKGRLVETAVSAGCITARRTFAISGSRV